MRGEEGGEGTSGARTRALNEILRGTEVALRLASPRPLFPSSLPQAAHSRNSARGGRAPPMGGADGRREAGALDQWGAPAWAGPAAAGESPLRPIITRGGILRCSALHGRPPSLAARSLRRRMLMSRGRRRFSLPFFDHRESDFRMNTRNGASIQTLEVLRPSS